MGIGSRLPKPLKSAILPVWNSAHRLAWRAGEYLDAASHRRFERCAACGRFGPMLYRCWVIPPELQRRWELPPRLAEALARKESSDCWACGAKLRARRIAAVILETYPAASRPKSVREWAKTPEARRLRIAEFNRIEGLHGQIAGIPSLIAAEYIEGATPGTVIDGLRHEDLTRLTLPDESLDLVLTSETLEHVPDLNAALAEIRRVLVPGGRHIFTVPLRPDVQTTVPRSVVRPDGTIDHRMTPIYHPGGDAGWPVFTEFGTDLPGLLNRAGFDAKLYFGPIRDDDIAQVFVTTRPVV